MSKVEGHAEGERGSEEVICASALVRTSDKMTDMEMPCVSIYDIFFGHKFKSVPPPDLNTPHTLDQ